MEDMKGWEALNLLIPGTIFPLTLLLKWITLAIFSRHISRSLIWRILWSSLLETATPFMSILIGSGIFIKNNYLNSFYYRVETYVAILFLLNCIVNYFSFARILKKSYPTYLLLIVALGVIATAAFLGAVWFYPR